MGSCIIFIGLGLGLIIIVVIVIPVGIDIITCPSKVPIGAVVAFSIICRLWCWILGFLLLSVLSCYIMVIFIVPRISSGGPVVSG
jgi:hypothetical protein